MLEKTESLGYLTNRLGRLLARRLQERLSGFGITPGQFTVLAEIARDEGLSQSALSDRLSFEQPGIARTLARLVKDGWIKRRTAEEDRRVQHISLTPRAREILAKATPEAVQVNSDALSGLADAEQTQLLSTLNRLIARLETQALTHPDA